MTGSGKTEVYIQAIREVVSYGRQAIVLVPEISLTPQTIRRFRSRFASVAVLHSHLSDAERHWHWQRIAEGEVQVVVGARSAVFAPTPHLGLIVIDEEHETTFKQQSTPRYHAREVARQRCLQEGVPLILGSATPTLESLHRARTGLDVLLSLPGRVNERPMPPVVIVDVRNDPQISRGHSVGRPATDVATSERSSPSAASLGYRASACRAASRTRGSSDSMRMRVPKGWMVSRWRLGTCTPSGGDSGRTVGRASAQSAGRPGSNAR